MAVSPGETNVLVSQGGISLKKHASPSDKTLISFDSMNMLVELPHQFACGCKAMLDQQFGFCLTPVALVFLMF